MTTRSSSTSQEKLLTPEQESICENIAEIGSIDSPRAKALLLVHAGSTQDEAAKLSGLSSGQVKYWITRFHNVGLSCFTTQKPTDSEHEEESSVEKSKKIKKKHKKQEKAKKSADKEKSSKKEKAKKKKEEKKAKKAKKKSKKKSKKKK